MMTENTTGESTDDDKVTGNLTPREREILFQLAEGRLNKEIGDLLSISVDTVKKHVKNIYRKINVRNRVEAGQHAYLLKTKQHISKN